MRRHKKTTGFTLIETVVSVGIFAILVSGALGVFNAISQGSKAYRESATITALAAQYMEIARNLPYSKIGTLSGNPNGSLPDLPNAIVVTLNNRTYKLYYDVTYVDDPADGTAALGTDPAPADYKQVKLTIQNTTTNTFSYFVTNIVPKGLEGLGSGGALSLKVINAVGQPVPNATVNITNTALVPAINLSRVTDANGNWIEVGLPFSNTSYHVAVSKTGYSSDQTYPSSGGNPNPTKPDATVATGQVTQISFAIDQLSNLTFSSQNQSCAPIANVGLNVKGAKLIGTPKVLKFDNPFTTNGSGISTLSNIEWDTYTPSLTGNTYMIYGSSPIQQISVLPNTSQTFTLILGPNTANSLLVIVKDSATGNAIENAQVNLQTSSPVTSNTKLTGGSIFSQQSWVGGSGQINATDLTKYFADNTNISNSGTPTGVRLATSGPDYLTPGDLTSSTFDSGSATTSYTTISWQPTSQNPSTTLKFQVASNNDNATWNYTGPDGTASTYYTTSGTAISASNNNNRYFRYKVFLSTTDTTQTPVLTSVTINYVSGCFTPGQVIYPGLASGSNYSATISAAGYQPQTITPLNISGYNVLQILMSP
jgi:type II secretory pathway pseudopilin PulG